MTLRWQRFACVDDGKFDALGMIFDDSYHFHNYVKFTAWIKTKPLDLDRSTGDQGKP